MKKQIRFETAGESYRFVAADNESISFEIDRSELIFSANNFYQCFFKGLKEKPQYELVAQNCDNLDKEAKHVFETVKGIFEKACESIDEKWFTDVEKQDPDAVVN